MGIFSDLKEGFDDVVDTVVDFGKDTIDTVVDLGKDAVDTVVDFGKDTIETVADFGKDVIDIGVAAFDKDTTVLGEIKDLFGNTKDNVIDIGDNLWDNLKETGSHFAENESETLWHVGSNLMDLFGKEDISQIMDVLDKVGLGDESTRDVAYTLLCGDIKDRNKIIHNILTDPSIAKQMDSEMVSKLITELSKIDLGKDANEAIALLNENKEVICNAFDLLSENGLSSQDILLIADKFLTTPGSQEDKIFAAVNELISNEDFINNFNKDFVYDLVEIAKQLDVGDKYNEIVLLATQNADSLCAIGDLLTTNGISKETIINAGLCFLETGSIEDLGNFLFENEEIQTVISNYKEDFINTLNSPGTPIKDSEMGVSSNELTNKENLLLSNLQYTNLFTPSNEGKTVKELIEELDTNKDGVITNEELVTKDDYAEILKQEDRKMTQEEKDSLSITKPGWMSEDELVNMLNDAYQNENINSLTLKDSADISANYLSASTFESPSGKATIIFEGTTDAQQWSDNVDGLIVDGDEMQNTAVQAAAENYVRQINAQYGYTDITVAGHSKGGNLSQYVTVMCPELISSCVSYDGQGFSEDWIKANQELVNQAKDKITSICSYADPINSLLKPITDNIFFVDCVMEATEIPTNIKDIKQFIQDSHSPCTMYTANENGWKIKEQCMLTSLIQDISNISELLPMEEKELLNQWLTEALDKGYCTGSTVGDKDLFKIEGTEIHIEGYELDLIKTNKGYAVYDANSKDDIVLALFDDKGDLISGSLAQVNDRVEISQVEDVVKNKILIAQKECNGITDPQKYLTCLADNIDKENIFDVFKIKDIDFALKQLGSTDKNFSAFCSQKDTDELRDLFSQAFEEILNEDGNIDENSNFVEALASDNLVALDDSFATTAIESLDKMIDLAEEQTFSKIPLINNKKEETYL